MPGAPGGPGGGPGSLPAHARSPHQAGTSGTNPSGRGRGNLTEWLDLSVCVSWAESCPEGRSGTRLKFGLRQTGG